MTEKNVTAPATIKEVNDAYSVIDTSTTIVVNRYGYGFRINSLSNNKEVYMDANEFFGNSFKYPGDFMRTFAKKFDNAENVILSTDANVLFLELLSFNRIDN